MQSLHYMTLLEELRVMLLANADSGKESGRMGAEITQATSSYVEEPSPWSSTMHDSLATAANAYRIEGKSVA